MKKPTSKRLGGDPLAWIQDSKKQAGQEADSQVHKKRVDRDAAALPGKVSRPTGINVVQSTPKGSALQGGWTRKTYEAPKQFHDDILALTFSRACDVKDIIYEALDTVIKKYKSDLKEGRKRYQNYLEQKERRQSPQ